MSAESVEPVEAVVFDVDGTLVDSERDGHRIAFNRAFAEQGLPDRWDVETYGRLLAVAGGARRLARWFESRGMSADEARELAGHVHARKTDLMKGMVVAGEVRARPGAVALTDLLRSSGTTLAVATTGTRTWVEPLLDLAFGARFSVVVTGTEVPDLKPSPAAYVEALARLGCDPSRAVAVEDSANGLQAALAAGLRCVTVRNDYTRDHDTSGASLVVDTYHDARLAAWFRDRISPSGPGYAAP